LSSPLGGPEAAMKALRVLVLSPIVILLITCVRLLLIANYDSTTALSIATSSGVVSTLVGTTIPLLPPYLPVFAVAALLFRHYGIFVIATVSAACISPLYGDPVEAYRVTIHTIEWLHDELSKEDWIKEVFWTQLGMSLTVAAGLLLALWAGLKEFRFSVLPVWARPIAFVFQVAKGVVVAAIAGCLMLYAENIYHFPVSLQVFSDALRKPWIPAERITLESGQVKVAYTLSNSEDWYLILNDDYRTVEYLHSDEVIKRQICTIKTTQEPALPAVPLVGATRPQPRMCDDPS
jgi:hypothetical protein